MPSTPEEIDQRRRFEEFYERARAPVMRAIERRVCGCDYGGNSWTTEAEARRIVDILSLRPGVRLLDLGAGSGWPGLYLAKISGCDLVLSDLPLGGLRIAAERAVQDDLRGGCWLAVADAASPPFPGNSFDALSHSDLLCCLKEKRAVLEACRRVIRPDGRMAFTVIATAPGLDARAYRRAVANGPEFIEADTDYPTMLRDAGWHVVARQDLTADYAESCRRQLRADEEHESALAELFGRAAYDERQAGFESKIAALGEGLLRRELHVAAPA